MVSDVSPDSPLNGWIFPSDIVIAVDEKAVSGLRVREIVDLLKSRKDRQRALRVISSHDLQDIVAQEVPIALLG
jgi:C-terminal processing protease CtpA/Prc